MGCLLLSEPRFITLIFHHSKGTPNVFSFVEKFEVAWQILLFHIREKQHITSSYNQGTFAISQTQPPSIWKLPGPTGKPTPWRYSSPNASVLRKATLAYFPPRRFLWSGNQGSKTNVMPHTLWLWGWCRKFWWLESHSRLTGEVWLGRRNLSFQTLG